MVEGQERKIGWTPSSPTVSGLSQAEIELLPVVRQRVAVKVVAAAGQLEGGADGNGEVGASVGRRLVGVDDGAAGRTIAAAVDEGTHLIQAFAMKEVVAGKLQIVGAADSCIGLDRRAAAGLVGRAGREGPAEQLPFDPLQVWLPPNWWPTSWATQIDVERVADRVLLPVQPRALQSCCTANPGGKAAPDRGRRRDRCRSWRCR